MHDKTLYRTAYLFKKFVSDQAASLNDFHRGNQKCFNIFTDFDLASHYAKQDLRRLIRQHFKVLHWTTLGLAA